MGAIHVLNVGSAKMMEHLKLTAFNFRVLATLNIRHMPRTLLLGQLLPHMSLAAIHPFRLNGFARAGTTVAGFAIIYLH
jgi:hypothetical protein